MDNNIYGQHYDSLNAFMTNLKADIEGIREELKDVYGHDMVDHVMARMKSDDSVREKCERRGINPEPDLIIANIYDAVGIRVVCSFIDDVYKIRDRIRNLSDVEVVTEKDYIVNAKPNGYRSYHMIVRNPAGYCAEIQIRTISMDTWAALEHNMKYKKDIKGNKELITAELKRCADELASTDVSMQTIRNMIFGEL